MSEEIGNLMLMPATIDKFAQTIRADGRTPKGIKVIGRMADLVPHQQLIDVTALLPVRCRNTFGATETGSAPCRGLIPIGKVVVFTLAQRLFSLCWCAGSKRIEGGQQTLI